MYIHSSVCISPQHTFSEIQLDDVVATNENKLTAIEPNYEGIPLNILRRMGKAVRMGTGAALPLLKKYPELNGVIIGTANGGLEDSFKFLEQVIKYNEGALTPTNFVQSTTNAIAAQVGLTGGNHGYNITHVHRGLAFENSAMDAQMLLNENPQHTYLLGGVDEISSANYNMLRLGKWFKEKKISSHDLYSDNTAGSIAGEGAAMFVVNNNSVGALAKLSSIKTIETNDADEAGEELQHILNTGNAAPFDLLLSGENGDNRLLHFYSKCESLMNGAAVARYKHLSGEYATGSAFALWLACNILHTQHAPAHLFKNNFQKKIFQKIVIYNTYQGRQHSFMVVTKS